MMYDVLSARFLRRNLPKVLEAKNSLFFLEQCLYGIQEQHLLLDQFEAGFGYYHKCRFSNLLIGLESVCHKKVVW